MSGRTQSRIIFRLLLSAAFSVPAWADVPTRYEQFIYTSVAYNGRDYSGTFVRQPVDSLYLIADSDSFLSAKLAFVYFWPLSGDYRLDTDTLSYPLPGTLRVEGGGTSRRLSLEKYTYYRLREEYEPSWKVATGEAAERAYDDYQKLLDRYSKAQADYRSAEADYERRLDELMVKISELHDRGGDTSAVAVELRRLKQPESPSDAVTDYITPPMRVQEAFVVNLPAGSYRLSFVSPDGKVVEGSEKRLIVFSRRGTQSVGYDVIPGDKWTRPEASDLPSSIIYVNGATDLYLRPYFEAKYKDLFYRKLGNNDATGNASLLSWVKLRQVPQARLLLRAGGVDESVNEAAFGVEQVGGSSLGYKIVPWRHAEAKGDKMPDIIAYRVAMRADHRVIFLHALDQTETPLSGSDREIRIVAGSPLEPLLGALVLAPLVPMVIVMVRRSRRYRR